MTSRPFIVYQLRSLSDPDHYYTGVTQDLDARIVKHDEGGVPATKFRRPWTLVVAIYFSEEQKARAFERYLKTGSGRAFSRRHF